MCEFCRHSCVHEPFGILNPNPNSILTLTLSPGSARPKKSSAMAVLFRKLCVNNCSSLASRNQTMSLFTFAAKKLGGQLDVVSYHEVEEGENLSKFLWTISANIGSVRFVFDIMLVIYVFFCFWVAEGNPPGVPSGVQVCEIDRTYVVLSWKSPPYYSKAPMWYYLEKVSHFYFITRGFKWMVHL